MLAQELLPLLTFLAGSGGSGWAAQALFVWLRKRNPKPIAVVWNTVTGGSRLFLQALWTPRYARWTVFVLAGMISVLSGTALAYLSGENVNLAFQATLSVVVSQLLHGAGLSSAIALDATEERF